MARLKWMRDFIDMGGFDKTITWGGWCSTVEIASSWKFTKFKTDKEISDNRIT